MGCIQSAKDSKHPRTSPVIEPAGPKRVSGQQADNARPETAVENAEKKETKLAALSWEQTDISLTNDGEDDCS